MDPEAETAHQRDTEGMALERAVDDIQEHINTLRRLLKEYSCAEATELAEGGKYNLWQTRVDQLKSHVESTIREGARPVALFASSKPQRLSPNEQTHADMVTALREAEGTRDKALDSMDEASADLERVQQGLIEALQVDIEAARVKIDNYPDEKARKNAWEMVEEAMELRSASETVTKGEGSDAASD